MAIDSQVFWFCLPYQKQTRRPSLRAKELKARDNQAALRPSPFFPSHHHNICLSLSFFSFCFFPWIPQWCWGHLHVSVLTINSVISPWPTDSHRNFLFFLSYDCYFSTFSVFQVRPLCCRISLINTRSYKLSLLTQSTVGEGTLTLDLCPSKRFVTFQLAPQTDKRKKKMKNDFKLWNQTKVCLSLICTGWSSATVAINSINKQRKTNEKTEFAFSSGSSFPLLLLLPLFLLSFFFLSCCCTWLGLRNISSRIQSTNELDYVIQMVMG